MERTSIEPTLVARHGMAAAGAIMRGILRQAGARLVGPGGYYNAGNALGLAAGIAVAISAIPEGGMGVGGVLGATLAHLGGDPTALALTGATAIFFWSGECYHRAWANGFPPIEALNRRGDFLSGIGALILGLALLSLGQPVLAATAGLLHALGKFGSARHWRPLPGWQGDWPNFYRTLVLVEPRPGDPRDDPRPRRRPRRPDRRHPVERLADAAGLPRLLRLLVPRRPDALRVAGQGRPGPDPRSPAARFRTASPEEGGKRCRS